MADGTATESNTIAFPRLEPADIEALKPLATDCSFEDGQTVFRAGDSDRSELRRLFDDALVQASLGTNKEGARCACTEPPECCRDDVTGAGNTRAEATNTFPVPAGESDLIVKVV